MSGLATASPEPRAWLTLTARRRAIDLLRRERVRVGKEAASAALLALLEADDPADDPSLPATALRDDLLRLLFTCCHPSLSTETQTALALRTLCGLTTAEVASALLVSEATMAKRLTRARRKIATAGIPYRVPSADELPARLDGVLTTVYLLFNEGYQASAGATPMRVSSAPRRSASRPCCASCSPTDPGLRARGAAAAAGRPQPRPARRGRRPRPSRRPGPGPVGPRPDPPGPVPAGIALRLSTAQPDPYVVQAAIAACHDLAPSWEETSWTAIVSWYDVLLAVHDTPVVRLNRAVAIAERDGTERASPRSTRSSRRPYAGLPAARGGPGRAARPGRTRRRGAVGVPGGTGLPGNDATKRELSRRMNELTGHTGQRGTLTTIRVPRACPSTCTSRPPLASTRNRCEVRPM